MTTIKFRAWDTKMKTWIPDGQSDYVFTPSHFIEDGLDISTHYHKAKNAIFLQFTGLKDNNKKEIYDSDVVKDGMGNLYSVGMGWADDNEDTSPACWVLIPEGHDGDYIALSPSKARECEVVGNIHENPELL